MPVYAEGRVEHQKRTQTATTLWPFGFVFGVQLGSLEKRKRGVPGTCRAASNETRRHVPGTRTAPFTAALYRCCRAKVKNYDLCQKKLIHSKNTRFFFL